jgi:type IV secretion system protein VirB10
MMSKEKNKLSPEASPSGIKVKRLNRKPMFIVFMLGLGVLTAFTYLIIMSGNRQRKKTETETAPYAIDQTIAKSLLAGKPLHGVIEPLADLRKSEEPTKEEPQKKEKHPKPKKPELTLEQKEMARIKQAKLRRFEQALTAPLSTGGSNTPTALSPSSTSSRSNPSQKGNAFDRMMKERESMRTALGNDKDPNKQKHKAEFYLQDQPATEYLQHTRNKQMSPLEVKTGTVIPATMIGGINSDLPGEMLAQVSQHVYDTATGDYLLIPQGSRLVGVYDNYISYGQNRALVKWKRLIYPDGSTIELEGMPGIDQAGYAGFEDQVDHHYFRVFGSAILMSIITGAYDYSQGNTTGIASDVRTVGDTMASSVARELSQTSQALLRKNLSVQPTIKIRPGYKFNVMVNRDIIFPSVW